MYIKPINRGQACFLVNTIRIAIKSPQFILLIAIGKVHTGTQVWPKWGLDLILYFDVADKILCSQLFFQHSENVHT